MKKIIFATIIMATSLTINGCGSPTPEGSLPPAVHDMGTFEFSEPSAASNPYTRWTIGTTKGRFAAYTSLHAPVGTAITLNVLNPNMPYRTLYLHSDTEIVPVAAPLIYY